MLYPNVYVFSRQLQLIDAATVGVSAAGTWLAGTWLSLWPAVPVEPVLLFLASMVATFIVVAHRQQVYHARRTEKLYLEIFALAEVTLISVSAGCLVAQVSTSGLPGEAYLAIGGVAMTVLLGSRLALRLVMRRLRRNQKDRRWWLVVGRNERSERLIREIESRPSYGIGITAVVDLVNDRDGAHTNLVPGEIRRAEDGRTMLIRDEHGLKALLEQAVIDEVAMCLPVRSCYDHIERMFRVCEEAGVSVIMPPNVFEHIHSRSGTRLVGGIPTVVYYTGPDDWSRLLVKRLFDLVTSAAALVLLSPLLLAVFLAVRATSAGPAFFLQTRTGFHGRPFRMIKFRTMVQNADAMQQALRARNETDGPAFKIEHDPRITPVGRFLRKYHLDELPQLWNVLVGEMSIVGPRPLPPHEATGNEWWQRRRLSMPPGLTCLWQAEGDHRIPFDEWMRMDLDYIDRWSLRLDLRILLHTTGTLVRGTGW